MTPRFDLVLSADAVVVGTGIAGLTAALELAPQRVVLLTKDGVADGSTPYAQGGIAPPPSGPTTARPPTPPTPWTSAAVSTTRPRSES